MINKENGVLQSQESKSSGSDCSQISFSPLLSQETGQHLFDMNRAQFSTTFDDDLPTCSRAKTSFSINSQCGTTVGLESFGIKLVDMVDMKVDADSTKHLDLNDNEEDVIPPSPVRPRRSLHHPVPTKAQAFTSLQAFNAQNQAQQLLGNGTNSYLANPIPFYHYSAAGSNASPTNTSINRHFPPGSFSTAVLSHGDQPTATSQLLRSEASPQRALVAPPISPGVPTVDVPSNVPFLGSYGFQMYFSKSSEAETKKTIPYAFSEGKSKLFVKKDAICPVHFKFNTAPPKGALIRAMVVYLRPQDMGEPVQRCMNDIMKDGTDEYRYHLMRCQNAGTEYHDCTNATPRHSITFPVTDPQSGSDHITGFFTFKCFSSCTGTINRRPMQLLITLECGGQVLGRSVVELRICACPGRDKSNDENPVGLNTSSTSSGRRKSSLPVNDQLLATFKRDIDDADDDHSMVGNRKRSHASSSGSEDTEYVTLKMPRRAYEVLHKTIDYVVGTFTHSGRISVTNAEVREEPSSSNIVENDCNSRGSVATDDIFEEPVSPSLVTPVVRSSHHGSSGKRVRLRSVREGIDAESNLF